ncbi:MAG: hypothetical protein ACXW18_05800 [Pyrinomonadaceae bacterium]
MATKKSYKKPARRKALLDSDPPILVGGGGSSYLWVNLDQNERPVNPSSNDPVTGIKPGAPTPRNRGNYSCSRVSRTPPKIYFYDGVNPETQLDIPVAGRNKWFIRFE